MLKYPITYTDFDGVEKTEDFWFNLTTAECIELQTSFDDENGFAGVMEKAVAANNKGELIKIFKDILKRAYGVRVGGNFLKSEEHSDAFATTEAYSVLFMQLMSGDAQAIAFLRGIMPADVIAKADALEEPVFAANQGHAVPKPSKLDQKAIYAELNERTEASKLAPLSKQDILLKMAIKSGKAVNLDQHQVEMLSQSELEQALANGSQIDGVTL